MRAKTVAAVFNSLICIAEITTALISQAIQRAIAEQAAEGLRIRPFVAGEVLTFPVLEEIVIRHSLPLIL